MVALVQRPAPGFKAPIVVGGVFEDISLSDYLGKWVVLLFYPMDFTFVCPTEILAFNDALPALKEINTVVLGVSTDSQFSHLAWSAQPRKQGGLGPDLKLPLVADKSMQISRDYGVLLEDEGIALRGLFIIDPKGILRQITVNDLPVGRSVEETIRLVKAFQFTDEYGEVCPANWKEGSKTIKADPKASLEYFANPDAEPTNGVPSKRPRLD
ncbi:thioredoxin-like protein [Mycena maculata]|uniref:thioredoxin-dependent peroxiredoxin n=1 Tax=Mycena maculata TaxID=230809 RepID=A0AAD7HFA4_9AGAR|nr:thioredoxin-like protein [Mycena maculata]